MLVLKKKSQQKKYAVFSITISRERRYINNYVMYVLHYDRVGSSCIEECI